MKSMDLFTSGSSGREEKDSFDLLIDSVMNFIKNEHGLTLRKQVHKYDADRLLYLLLEH